MTPPLPAKEVNNNNHEIDVDSKVGEGEGDKTTEIS